MPFAEVSQPGLTRLLKGSADLNEVKEVLKFLTFNAAHFGGSYVNPPPANYQSSKEFWDASVSDYPVNSSISVALKSFGEDYLEHFEHVCHTHLGEETLRALTMSSNDPDVIKVKLWLVECACHSDTDPDGSLGIKLRSYRVPQPIYSPAKFLADGYPMLPVPDPDLLHPEVANSPMPELARALYLLVKDYQESSMPVEEEDYYHVLREFFRLAINCAEVWKAYGPGDWDFRRGGRPKLSENALIKGFVEVYKAWFNMIRNPFSDAPHHVRWFLSECDIIGAANYFLVDVRVALFSAPFDSGVVNMKNVTRHYIMGVQHAAESFDHEVFSNIKATRLGNLNSITEGRPNNEMQDVLRQTPGELFVLTGLPLGDELDLPDEAELVLTEEPVNEQPNNLVVDEQVQQHDEWLEPPEPPAIIDPVPAMIGNRAEENMEDPVNAQVLAEDARVYRHEFRLGIPPEVRAYGPRNHPMQCGQAVQESDLHEDDMCSICTCELLNDEDKDIIRLRCNHLVHRTELDEFINAAYYLQRTINCPICRAEICRARNTEQIFPGML